MNSAQRTTLVGVSILSLGLIYALIQLNRSDTKLSEPSISELPLERSDGKLWSPQTEALVLAFPARKGALEELREMMGTKRVAHVSLLDDELQIGTEEGERYRNEGVADQEQWSELMKRAGIVGISKAEFLKMIVVFPRPSKTTPDRYETINYYFNHPYPAKQCSDQYRDIPCGVCDVMVGDNWSIRHSWSSGKFESEYSEDFLKVYGANESGLSIEEINAKLDAARKECSLRGLEEMGYDDPGLY